MCGFESIAKLNHRSEEKWEKLIEYGIERGEFNNVDVDEIYLYERSSNIIGKK